MTGDIRDLHVLTHSFPTRRASDLVPRAVRSEAAGAARCAGAPPRTRRHPGAPRIAAHHVLPCRRRTLPAAGAGAGVPVPAGGESGDGRSEEHTSELQSLMRISYAVFCLKKKTQNNINMPD